MKLVAEFLYNEQNFGDILLSSVLNLLSPKGNASGADPQMDDTNDPSLHQFYIPYQLLELVTCGASYLLEI